mmetsp:Transcript_13916/g.33640  ORF Transcript_13916/g.33640 Transcript_13916/m.33640 type:complete len:111 (-) Transcript_13916:4-336(-)
MFCVTPRLATAKWGYLILVSLMKGEWATCLPLFSSFDCCIPQLEENCSWTSKFLQVTRQVHARLSAVWSGVSLGQALTSFCRRFFVNERGLQNSRLWNRPDFDLACSGVS